MKKKTLLSVLVLSFVFMLPLFYNNCAASHDDGSANLGSLGGKCDAILKTAFESGYWGFVKTNCGDCHASGPGSGLFASNNLDSSWASFKDKTQAKIADFAVGSHKPGYTGPALQPAVDALAPAWTTAQEEFAACQASIGDDDDVGGGTLTTPNRFTLAKPANPAANQSVTLTWNLATEMENSAHNLVGVQFEIQVRAYDLGGGVAGYEFRLPRAVNTGAAAAYIRGIGVKVNNVLVPNGTTFYLVERYIPNLANNNARGFASTGGAIIYPSVIGTAISVAVGFTENRAAGIDFRPPTYQELAAAGGIFNTSCFGCHGANGGFNIQNYSNLVGRNGASGLTLVTPFDLNNSYIYQRMINAASPMPPTGLVVQDQRDRIRDWILDGAPNTAANRP